MFVKNVNLLDFLHTCTDEQLQDVEFLEDMLKNKIGIRLNFKTLEIDKTSLDFRCGGMKMKQYPNEFAKYLAWLYKLMKKKWIKNYMCIGPENGGEFFTIDSFFRRLNPKYQKSLCLDLHPNILWYNFEKYKQKNDVQFIEGNSHDMTWDDIPFDTVDYCFIDGDHSYNGVKQDFEMVKDHAKYIAFHDIKLTIGKNTVWKFWNEIRKDYHSWEFINEDPRFPVPVGIGVIKVR